MGTLTREDLSNLVYSVLTLWLRRSVDLTVLTTMLIWALLVDALEWNLLVDKPPHRDNVSLILAWLIPALVPVSELKTCGYYVYLLAIFCFFSILIAFSFSCYCIHRQEKKLKTNGGALAVVESVKNSKFHG